MNEDRCRTIRRWGFTWDIEKDRANRQKHRVSFEEACEVFFDLNYVMVEDSSAQGEQRWLLTGYSERNRLLTVVAAEVEETAWRIISAWPASREERREYEEDDDS